eukprot:1878737-Pyramimonas_sp.AAC.1
MAHIEVARPKLANNFRTTPGPHQNHPRTTREPLLNHARHEWPAMAKSGIATMRLRDRLPNHPRTTPEPS